MAGEPLVPALSAEGPRNAMLGLNPPCGSPSPQSPLQWGVAGDAGEKAVGDGEKADGDGDATLAWLPWVPC